MNKPAKLKNKNQNSVIKFLPLIILILVLPIVLLVLAIPTNLIKKAAPDQSQISATKTTYTVPIMLITFLPDENKDGFIDPETTGVGGSSPGGWVKVNDLRTKLKSYTDQAITIQTNATKYRGYKNPQAIPAITYKLAEGLQYEELINPPKSNRRVPWNTVNFRPDYNKILTKYNICDAVDNKGVKEVWMWSQHYANWEPNESNMASKLTGDISNSEKDATDMPICNKTYTLYNYNFTRGVPEMIHNRGHQIEELMQKFAYNLYWQRWAGVGSDNEIHNPGCGWTHEPPNSGIDTSDGKRYDYFSTNTRSTTCENWNPNGGGQTTQVSCKTYEKYYYGTETCDRFSARSEIGFYTWWQQNLPGYGNDLYDGDKKLRNFWDIIGDYDNAVLSGDPIYLSSKPTTDTSAPLVEINNPQLGDKVSGTIKISTGAFDNVGIVSHKLFIDNYGYGKTINLIKDCGRNNICEFSLDVDNMEIYPDERTNFFVIVVEALDAAGNKGRKYIEVEKVSNPVISTTPLPTPIITPTPTGIVTPTPTKIPTPVPTSTPITHSIRIKAEGRTNDGKFYPILRALLQSSQGTKDLGLLTIKDRKDYYINFSDLLTSGMTVRLQFCNESSSGGECGNTPGGANRDIIFEYITIDNGPQINFNNNTSQNEVVIYDRANKEDFKSQYDWGALGDFGNYTDGITSNDPKTAKGKLVVGNVMYGTTKFTGSEILWAGELRIKVP